MAQFDVTPAGGGWVQADCRELGVLITARSLGDAKETARRTAARLRKEATFRFRPADRASLLTRALSLLFGPRQ